MNAENMKTIILYFKNEPDYAILYSSMYPEH